MGRNVVRPQMTSEEWHDILTLLTIVVLADKRVYKEEVDTFVQTVKHLNDTISPETFMTEGMAFDWFKSNRERVGKMLVGKDVERNIKDTISRTKKVHGKAEIVKAMEKIAQADSDYHKSEHGVIRRAAYGWGVAYT